jgi:hypothetical protein
MAEQTPSVVTSDDVNLSHGRLNKSLGGHGDVGGHSDVHVTELSQGHESFPENIAQRIIDLSNAAHASQHLSKNFQFVFNRVGGADLRGVGKNDQILRKSGEFLTKVVRASEMKKSEMAKYADTFANGPALALRSPDQRFVKDFIPVVLIVTNKATRDAFKAFLKAVELVDPTDGMANVQSPKLMDVVLKADELVRDYEQEVAGLSNRLVISSITNSLDRLASILESRGLSKYASMLDNVSNTLALK